MAGPIRISILANASQAKREMDDVANSTSGLGSKLGKFGKAAGVAAAAGLAVAGAAALKFGSDSVKSASDAQQSLGATQTVFGKYAQSVIDNSNKAATAVGLSANEYRELNNTTGALLAGAGTPLKKVAGLTDDLTKRAADMAATFGGTTKESVEAISSLLKGEADPIERYGVSIKQSDVNARLAAKGLDGLTGSALKQAEQQARLDLLFQKTSKTSGAFARESNTLAHQQQVLGAQFENIKAKVGTALLPVLTTLLTFLNAKIGPAFTAVAGFMAPLVDRIRNFLSSLTSGTGAAAPFMTTLQTLGNTIMTVVVPAVKSVFGYFASKLMPVFSQVAGIVSGQVIPIFTSVALFMVGTLVPAVVAIAAKVGNTLKPVFEQLVATFTGKVLPTVQKLLAKFQEYQPTIQKVITQVVKVVGAVLEFAAAILAKVLPVAIRFAGYLISNVVPAVADVIGVVIKIIAKVIDFGGALVDAVKEAGKFLSGVKEKIGAALDFIREIPDKVTGFFSNAGTLLTNIGRSIIQGLVNGLESAKQWVIDKIQEIADVIPGWVKKRLGIASPSKVTTKLGKQTGQGLADGIASMKGKVSDAAQKVAEKAIEKIKDKIEKAKGVRDSILSLGRSIGETLTGDLFGFNGDEESTALDKFRNGLAAAKATAEQVAAAMKQLSGKVSNKFLEKLAASGNTELIVQLAGAPDVATLAAQYDAVIQQNEDTGRIVAEQVIGVRLDAVNENIANLVAKLEQKNQQDAQRDKDGLKVAFSVDLANDLSEIEKGRKVVRYTRAFQNAGGRLA